MTNRLERLLRPRSIAVVGGGVWCANVIAQCRAMGFAGELWPVHPTRAEVAGVPAHASIADLPAAPDAAFVGINRHATLPAVAALAARGGGGAVCFASGFREATAETADGAAQEAALVAAAGDMGLLGPNCYGFINYLDGAALWPDQHGGGRVARGVAIVSQSSNIALNLTMQARGLPLAYVVTVGNQAQMGVAEVGRALLRDDRVTALGLYVEGVGDLRAFEALAADAHARGKPIVALKAGRSEQARAATVSHTASLAGSDAGAEALLRRLGIARARSVSGFLEALQILHVNGPLRSNRIASMSCSGGEAIVMADAVAGSGLSLPPLNARQTAGLRAALGAQVALANPLDYHTYIWGDEDAMAATFTAMMQGDLALGCVVLDFPRADRCDPAAWEPVIGAVARARATSGRPMAIVSSLPETLPEAVSRRLAGAGIVPLHGIAAAVEAIALAVAAGRPPAPAPLVCPPGATDAVLLTEAAAKAALAQHGVPVPRAARADRATVGAAAADVGFPVALKAEGLAHKTEAGAVALNLNSAAAVTAAASDMPGEMFLVEQMIAPPVAEMLIGVVADPAHGYVLTLGAGGVLAEVIQDSTAVLVPAGRADVRAALNDLRIARLLHGYRGRPPADLEAIVDTVMAVQSYVAQTRPQEVEINPLMCGTQGAVAADALIRRRADDA